MAEDPPRDEVDPADARIAELETQVERLTSNIRTIWAFLYVATLAVLAVLFTTIQVLRMFWPAFVGVGIFVTYLLLRIGVGK